MVCCGLITPCYRTQSGGLPGAFAVLGMINVLWGAMCALAQKDLKKMVAYSSISHMGFLLLGMAAVIAGGAANGSNLMAAQAGINGAVFQMFNHGTISGHALYSSGCDL
ncbi:MAG: hypothetical protein CM1200mP10_00370 [Candidatus Neomarinimicrobiota bacterium]|nr:MAG: hypothetical protein CM1200mP10_00370 [Candidatus Neomarinimicrobiota bacterium]